MKNFLKTLPLVGLMFSSIALAADNNMMVRMRSITVMPSEKGTPTRVGGDVKLSDATVPELDFTYFFNDHFAAELILASTQHRAAANKTSLNNLDLGEVSLLPPILLAQYHHTMGKWKPYIGAGLNYTIFYNIEPGVARSVHYKNSMGYAWQVGTDYEFLPNTYINFDIKKLYVSTDVEVNTYSNGTVKADVDINPWIVGLGLGYRF
ncbi:MAG: OmpW family protein [Bacteriovoracaceae bacterium]